MVGRGLGAWCDTWTMGHPRPKANFKGVWWGVGWEAWKKKPFQMTSALGQ
ncbi:hypothetical protein HanOQP8_Chr08g0283931 [Helianthus annuus]|nr:hypothetical protein HanHA89_Chr12g0488051 [Helianthus annuus]KAJ0722194.1 hypothetical protein HanOQP8_Chr08g0283931 [Helianthus annuus]